MKKYLFLSLVFYTYTVLFSYGQSPCSVITGNGIAVRTTNDIPVVHQSFGMDCNSSTSNAMAKTSTEDAGPKEKMVEEKDSDNDGIIDEKDNCPSVAGQEKFQGCPDSDGDGIMDKEDECPKEAGSVNGCPDGDGDGIVDAKDACPNEPGIANNKGCPEIEESTKELFKRALTGIQFESGKSVIKGSSYPILDKIANLMLQHGEYKLDIAGHTDNTGDATKNLKLSEDRANAAKQYLIQKGVPTDRLRSEGYGISKPIADNDTAAGRYKNRRVEFHVEF